MGQAIENEQSSPRVISTHFKKKKKTPPLGPYHVPNDIIIWAPSEHIKYYHKPSQLCYQLIEYKTVFILPWHVILVSTLDHKLSHVILKYSMRPIKNL